MNIIPSIIRRLIRRLTRPNIRNLAAPNIQWQRLSCDLARVYSQAADRAETLQAENQRLREQLSQQTAPDRPTRQQYHYAVQYGIRKSQELKELRKEHSQTLITLGNLQAAIIEARSVYAHTGQQDCSEIFDSIKSAKEELNRREKAKDSHHGNTA